MRIKRLDITGFKSFMDRMVFQFDEGITGVVGPNGCGKSNVVDAIRWAMGEQSAKNLRGRGMEDVIFNGSETHAPLNLAEVTLTFSVDERDVLPAHLSGLPEVSMTRRLFRSGESEYQMNRTTCRLLDITELFLGTGVGTKAYSIIEQGRVGQIVSSRPEDRRSFIEEAAGITKYKSRRKVAERKMEYTQQNLLRVNDIVAELEKRLDSVERQAKKAEKYKRLKGEMRDIELHSMSHRWLELSVVKGHLGFQLEALSADETQTLSKVQAVEADLSKRRSDLDAETLMLERLSLEASALENQVKLDVQNLHHWSADLLATEQRFEASQTEFADLLQKKSMLEAAYAESALFLQSMGVASREDEVALAVTDEELRRTNELVVQLAAQINIERSSLVDMATRVASHESKLQNLTQRQGELAHRIARLNGELEVLRAEESQLETNRQDVLGRVESHRQMSLELTVRRGEEEASLARAREVFSENELMVMALRDDLADKRSRLSSLEEIQANYDGFDRGVRAVMARAGSEPLSMGVFGLVAELVNVRVEHERAIEAALGERLQYVVVENEERAFDFLDYLKGSAEGRSTFIAVPTIEIDPAPLNELGVLGMASEAVTTIDERLRPLIANLLHGVVLTCDLDQAKRLSPLYPAHVFVTPEGEVVKPGMVTGGVLEGAAVGALQKKREIGELTVEVRQVEERYNELITRHYELQKQVGHSEGVLKGLEKNRHQEEISLATHEKDLHSSGSTLAKLRDRISGVQSETLHLMSALETVLFDLESSRGEAAHGQTEREQKDDRVNVLSSELENLKARSQALQHQETELKVKVASVSERGQAARQRVDALSTQLEELVQRVGRASTSRDEAALHAAELRSRTAETEVEREKRMADAQASQALYDARKHSHAVAQSSIKVEEVALKELRAKFDDLHQGLSQFSLRERELKFEMEHLAQALNERHQVTMAEAVHRYHAHRPVEQEAREKLSELRVQIERMGEVNVSAIDEHQEIRTRFEFLSKQKVDLEQSLKQLKGAIEQIDETSRARFKETFDIVNAKFEQVFPRLFGGGRASLMLVQGALGEEPGVEILAQPPGKKLQSVNLFSGGEKALTAVALIFAIFLIKPTPFCLLDEVDAPLDEGNVGRYNDMVREMSQVSQFILITHNKRTMEVADTLYGVTMEEPGVSKLVQVNLKKATAANRDESIVA
jgi:chromosome segregation protein